MQNAASTGNSSALPRITGAKKLTDDDLKHSLQRLYEQPCAKRKAKLSQDKTEIEDNIKRNVCRRQPKEQSEKDKNACKRLYEQPMKAQKNLMEHLEKKHINALEQGHPPKVRLTNDQSEEAIHRLYSQSVDHKKSVRDATEKKIYGEAPAARKLDKETLKENIDKLYSKAVDSKNEKRDALKQKYGWRGNCSSKTISKEKVTELVTRLGGK